MYHRNVRIVDVYWSRLILEIAGITISFILLMTIFIVLGFIDMPDNIFLMLCAWLLLALFTAGLGFVVGVMSEISEVFDRIWHTFTYLFLPFSGAFYFVDTLPTYLREIHPICAPQFMRLKCCVMVIMDILYRPMKNRCIYLLFL